jgi:hypothetical protein
MGSPGNSRSAAQHLIDREITARNEASSKIAIGGKNLSHPCQLLGAMRKSTIGKNSWSASTPA